MLDDKQNVVVEFLKPKSDVYIVEKRSNNDLHGPVFRVASSTFLCFKFTVPATLVLKSLGSASITDPTVLRLVGHSVYY